MDDRAIVDCIRGLAAEERHLRESERQRGALTAVETARLNEIGAGLEHMWHLLRQRRGGALPADLADDAGQERLTA
jgi:hypothetical protein